MNLGAAQDIAHLLGGGVLLLSFVLLYQRRLDAVIGALAVQGGLLALAVASQGAAQGAPGFYFVAALAFVAKALLIPLALRRLLRRLGLDRNVETMFGVTPALLAAAALVGLAVMVVLPVTAGNAPSPMRAPMRENLALALSVVLLGMLMTIVRRHPLSQVVGLLSLENGLMLAAIGVPGMPLLVGLSSAALVLMLALVAGLFLHLPRGRMAGSGTGPP